MQNDTDRRYRDILANGVLTGDRPIFDTGSMFGQIDRDGVDQLPQPIMLYTPITGRDEATGEPTTFVRGSQAVRPDGMLLGNNIASIYNEYNLLEGSATSYYCQPYSEVGGKITTEAPITRTVTLPSTGSYVLWCKGGAGLSVTVAAGTATGTGWGTITSGGYVALSITTAGTVTVTVMGGVAGDHVQLTTGAVPTSYIPTPTTAPVTRASEGADTSGNGLSIPLSQAMIDSLKGSSIDLAASWVEVTGGISAYLAYSNNNQTVTFSSGYGAAANIYKNSGTPMNLSIGTLYEINYTIAGYSGGGSFRVRCGSSAQGLLRAANGTFSERLTCVGNSVVYFDGYNNFAGSVTINYCRRVIDGQVNPGEGTVLVSCEFPWNTTALPQGTYNICSVTNSASSIMALVRAADASLKVSSYDGVLYKSDTISERSAGPVVIWAQWSAKLGLRRIGIYDPVTGNRSPASWQDFRGFFPIHSSNRLRFFFGGGNCPIGVGSMLWFDSILSDDLLIWAAREVQP